MNNTTKNSAILAAYRILSHARNTEGQLRDKLERQGYDTESIDAAIVFAKDNKYIADEEYIERAVEVLANEKLYGPARIPVELTRRGFTRPLIVSVDMNDIRENGTFGETEINFTANCARLIEKRGGLADDGRIDRKLYAVLQRYGYTSDIIREAVTLINE